MFVLCSMFAPYFRGCHDFTLNRGITSYLVYTYQVTRKWHRHVIYLVCESPVENGVTNTITVSTLVRIVAFDVVFSNLYAHMHICINSSIRSNIIRSTYLRNTAIPYPWVFASSLRQGNAPSVSQATSSRYIHSIPDNLFECKRTV